MNDLLSIINIIQSAESVWEGLVLIAITVILFIGYYAVYLFLISLGIIIVTSPIWILICIIIKLKRRKRNTPSKPT